MFDPGFRWCFGFKSAILRMMWMYRNSSFVIRSWPVLCSAKWTNSFKWYSLHWRLCPSLLLWQGNLPLSSGNDGCSWSLLETARGSDWRRRQLWIAKRTTRNQSLQKVLFKSSALPRSWHQLILSARYDEMRLPRCFTLEFTRKRVPIICGMYMVSQQVL